VPLNTFIIVLDQIASAWDGFKVMADHVRKVKVIESLAQFKFSLVSPPDVVYMRFPANTMRPFLGNTL